MTAAPEVVEQAGTVPAIGALQAERSGMESENVARDVDAAGLETRPATAPISPVG